jgi:cytochrome c
MYLLSFLASAELTAPVPRDLPLPLPLPTSALVAMLVGTFLLHILFVNLMVGGSLLTLFYEWRGRRSGRPHLDQLAYAICQTITVNKSLAVVLGVGPLLMMNLLYTVWFYSANALTGIAWIMVVPSVAAAFLLTYAQKYFWHQMHSRSGLHLALGVGAAGLFLFIPLIFLSNINLMLFPERWSDVRGFLGALLLPNVIQRYFHFLLASVAATALFLVWKAKRGTLIAGPDCPELASAALMRRFYRIAFAATALQFAAGPWLLLTLPRHGLGVSTLVSILTGVGFGVSLLGLIWAELRSSDQDLGRRLPTVVVVLVTIVLFMGTGRHNYRETTLAWHRDLVAAKTKEFVKLSEEARIEAAARAAAEQSGDPRILGESVYKQTCIACHQPTGQGIPGAFPPLAGSEWVTDLDPTRMIRIVLHGLEGPIRVRGVQYPGTAMPPHRDLLDDRKLAAVVTFARHAWGNNAPAVDPEAVARERRSHASRTKPWTEAELGRPQ